MPPVPALLPSCCFEAAAPGFVPRGLGGRGRTSLIFHPLRAAVPCLRTQHRCCCCHCEGEQTALSAASVPAELPRGGMEQPATLHITKNSETLLLPLLPAPLMGDTRGPRSCRPPPDTKLVLCSLRDDPYTAAPVCTNVSALAA